MICTATLQIIDTSTLNTAGSSDYWWPIQIGRYQLDLVHNIVPIMHHGSVTMILY